MCSNLDISAGNPRTRNAFRRGWLTPIQPPFGRLAARSRTYGDSHALLLQRGGLSGGVKVFAGKPGRLNRGQRRSALRLNMIDLIPDGLPTAVIGRERNRFGSGFHERNPRLCSEAKMFNNAASLNSKTAIYTPKAQRRRRSIRHSRS